MKMIEDFNHFLEEKSSVIRLYPSYTSVDIKIVQGEYLNMKDQIIIPTKEFYDELENFFTHKHGVELSFNNTRSSFWTKDLVNIIK